MWTRSHPWPVQSFPVRSSHLEYHPELVLNTRRPPQSDLLLGPSLGPSSHDRLIPLPSHGSLAVLQMYKPTLPSGDILLLFECLEFSWLRPFRVCSPHFIQISARSCSSGLPCQQNLCHRAFFLGLGFFLTFDPKGHTTCLALTFVYL